MFFFVSFGGHEYHFEIEKSTDKQYTLIISKVLAEYNSKTPLLVELPKNGASLPNQIINISGYPVGVSVTKISDTKVRINTDVSYDKNFKNNLVSFWLSSPDIKDDNIFSNTVMKSNLSSSPDYFEFNVDKNAKKLDLEFIHPLVGEQGPWNFNIKLNYILP